MGEWRKSSYASIERAVKAAHSLLIEEKARVPRIISNKSRLYRLTRAINQCDRALFFIKRDESSAVGDRESGPKSNSVSLNHDS